jgi:hypothetical protein
MTATRRLQELTTPTETVGVDVGSRAGAFAGQCG